MAHADAVAPSSSRAVRARPCALGGATRPPTDLCPLCDWTKAVPHATRHPAAVNVALWERDSVWLKTVAKAELDLVRQLLILLNEWQARVREVATMLLGTNTLLATFDVDEYVWPCDPLVPIAAVVRRAAVERAVLNCPRFGPVAAFDPAVPTVAQYTRRAPHGPLGDPETKIRRSIAACDVSVAGEGMPCFSSRPKAVYDLARLSARAAAWLSIHGVEEKNGKVNVSWSVVTTSVPPRAHGVCCNHYFAKDMADVRLKAEKNGNPFYAALAASPDLLAFFNYSADTEAVERFGPLMARLLAAAATA